MKPSPFVRDLKIPADHKMQIVWSMLNPFCLWAYLSSRRIRANVWICTYMSISVYQEQFAGDGHSITLECFSYYSKLFISSRCTLRSFCSVHSPCWKKCRVQSTWKHKSRILHQFWDNNTRPFGGKSFFQSHNHTI